MTNVLRRNNNTNNQQDEGDNADAEVGGGDSQEGQNDPNYTNAQSYDACKSRNQNRSGTKWREQLENFEQKVLKTLEHPQACWKAGICGTGTGCY